MSGGTLSTACDLHTHKCFICGKKFECSSVYVFKALKPQSRKNYNYFCSYHCFRENEKQKEKGKRRWM